MTKTKFILHNNQLDKDADVTSSHLVNEIPGDQACIVFLGGSGAILDSVSARLAGIVAREILKDTADIPNYALIYDRDIMNDKIRESAQKYIQFEKYNKNIFKTTETDNGLYFVPKYVSATNINQIVRQRIIPQIKKFGVDGIKKLQFIADGDVSKISSELQKGFKKYSVDMGLSSDDLNIVINHIKQNTFSYSKYFEPKYIDEIFNILLLPRISDLHGNKLPLSVAQSSLRKINILAHCQGAYVALMLSDRLQHKMTSLGYTPDEISQIQSQLLVVALAPICPLGVSKSRFISFMSAYDSRVERPCNWMTRYITENRECELSNINTGNTKDKWDLKAGFLGGRNGDVFYAKQRFGLVGNIGDKTIGWDEHNNSHFILDKFTADGQLLATFARNIVISGIKNSLLADSEFTPLPPTAELILDGKNDAQLSAEFVQLQRNGRELLKTVCEYAKHQVQKMMPESSVVRYRDVSERL